MLHVWSENNILNLVTQVHFLSFISAMLQYRITIVELEFSSQQFIPSLPVQFPAVHSLAPSSLGAKK